MRALARTVELSGLSGEHHFLFHFSLWSLFWASSECPEKGTFRRPRQFARPLLLPRYLVKWTLLGVHFRNSGILGRAWDQPERRCATLGFTTRLAV